MKPKLESQWVTFLHGVKNIIKALKGQKREYRMSI